MLRKPVITAVLVMLLAGAASAETIYLKEGATLKGKILEVSSDAIYLSLEGLQGSRIKVPVDRISDYGLYEIKRMRIDRNSVAAREKLGDWALDRGLFGFAMWEYEAAVKIAGKDAPGELTRKLALASASCGQDKLERGYRLAQEGSLEEARRLFKDIVKSHPACPSAKRAKTEIDRLNRRIAESRIAEREKREAEESVRDLKKGLDIVKSLIVDGERLRTLGLNQSGHFGRAEDAFFGSIQAYGRSRKVLQKVGALPGAAQRAREFVKLEKTLADRHLEVYVDLGHNFVAKGNLVKANHYMGLALAIDPNYPKALDLRLAIAIATASDRFPRSN